MGVAWKFLKFQARIFLQSRLSWEPTSVSVLVCWYAPKIYIPKYKPSIKFWELTTSPINTQLKHQLSPTIKKKPRSLKNKTLFIIHLWEMSEICRSLCLFFFYFLTKSAHCVISHQPGSAQGRTSPAVPVLRLCAGSSCLVASWAYSSKKDRCDISEQ